MIFDIVSIYVMIGIMLFIIRITYMQHLGFLKCGRIRLVFIIAITYMVWPVLVLITLNKLINDKTK